VRIKRGRKVANVTIFASSSGEATAETVMRGIQHPRRSFKRRRKWGVVVRRGGRKREGTFHSAANQRGCHGGATLYREVEQNDTCSAQHMPRARSAVKHHVSGTPAHRTTSRLPAGRCTPRQPPRPARPASGSLRINASALVSRGRGYTSQRRPRPPTVRRGENLGETQPDREEELLPPVIPRCRAVA